MLLADDDEGMRELLADTLRRREYRVTEASSGDELSAAVAGSDGARKYDLIVSDQHMPGATGVRMLEELRERGFRMPMLLMTAFAPPALRARAMRLGSIVLEKPFGLRDFEFAVERALLGRTPVHLAMPWSP